MFSIMEKFRKYGTAAGQHEIYMKGKIKNDYLLTDCEFVFVDKGKQLCHILLTLIPDDPFKVKCVFTVKNKVAKGKINRRLNSDFYYHGIKPKNVKSVHYCTKGIKIKGSFNDQYLPDGECTATYKNGKKLGGIFFNGITRYMGKLVDYELNVLSIKKI